jgi:hypothetical protein
MSHLTAVSTTAVTAAAAAALTLLMPLPYVIQTSKGVFHLQAVSTEQAYSTALELSGPNATIINISREEEW